MWDAGRLAIIMIFGIPLAAIIGSFVIAGLKIMKGDSSERDTKLRVQETRLIQEIHQGLSRMEQRVEALETILLDMERKGDDK